MEAAILSGVVGTIRPGGLIMVGRNRRGENMTRNLTAVLLASGFLASPSLAAPNSCSNVDIMGSFDESGLRESEYGIYAAGTFRIQNEAEESKQPYFNLATINCEKQ